MHRSKLDFIVQIGFQSGHRTADHVCTLKTLIDKHVIQNKNNTIYACFVDFKKAFDSVWHEGYPGSRGLFLLISLRRGDEK